MITKDFYNLIDGEIDELLKKYVEDDYLKKHTGSISNQKSYALLIWFLEFYGKIANYTPFITDGTNDSSCDIVFDKNGAQTVYSIYSAYKNASRTKRTQMNREALITLRLLKSGGKDFDLNVTRYTNSQNPIQDRDFYANEDIQVEL